MAVSETLDRFLGPQRTAYPIALAEIRRGKKHEHWMWYIFPQLRGLGKTTESWDYGIRDLEEAKAYLAHPVLGQRLLEITGVLVELEESDAVEIFGGTDARKLRSCMTLFCEAGGDAVFDRALDKFFGGRKDGRTLGMLRRKN